LAEVEYFNTYIYFFLLLGTLLGHLSQT
jgi:hypothetical protein